MTEYFTKQTERTILNPNDTLRLDSNACSHFGVITFSSGNGIIRGYTREGSAIIFSGVIGTGVHEVLVADLFRYIEVECTSGTIDLQLSASWR